MAESVIPKPGWFALGTEKRFREGVVAYLQHEWEPAAHSFAQAVEGDSRNLSDDFFLAATLTRLHRFTDAIPVMERVVASNQPLPDGLMQKYVPGTLEMQLPVTEHVTVGAGFDSIGASLILAELYQEVGRLEDAIGLVQRLHRLMPDEPTIRLSLADLLFSDDDFKGLIELTQDVENESTVELAMLHLRARALENDGLIEPAIEQLTACLRRTANRDPELLKAIRYDRAEAFERTGNERRAKSDWTKLVAEDPFYRDARSRLEVLASPSSA